MKVTIVVNNNIANNNNKDLTGDKHYLDPDDPNFVRDYWNLLESGVDDGLIIWSYNNINSINVSPSKVRVSDPHNNCVDNVSINNKSDKDRCIVSNFKENKYNPHDNNSTKGSASHPNE